MSAQVCCAVCCCPALGRGQNVQNTANLDTKFTVYCWIASKIPPTALLHKVRHDNTRQIGTVCVAFSSLLPPAAHSYQVIALCPRSF